MTIYTRITEETITAAKRPPANPPLINGMVNNLALGYQNDATTILNYLRRKQFSFAYRYIYDDNEKSNFSAFSEVPVPVNDELLSVSFTSNRGANNLIRLGLNSGSELVRHIEVVVKVNALGAWESLETIDKQQELIGNNVDFIYEFRNDRGLTPIDQATVTLGNNFIPQLADAQEFLPTNELCYGGVTEGFDNIETDITLTAVGLTKEDTGRSNIARYLTDYRIIHWINIELPTAPPPEIQSFNFRLQLANGNVHNITIEQSAINTYPDDLKSAILRALNSVGFASDNNGTVMQPDDDILTEWDIRDGSFTAFDPGRDFNPYEGVGGHEVDGRFLHFINYINWAESKNDLLTGGAEADSYFPNIIDRVVDSAVLSYNLDTPTPILPTPVSSFGNGRYEAGIIYEDGYGRSSFVQTNPEAEITIDTSQLFTSTDIARRPVVVDMRVRHLPPSWARYWRPVVTKNLSETIVGQWVVDHSYVQELTDRNILGFSFSSSLLESKQITGAESYGSYTYQPGDLVRVVGRLTDTLNTRHRSRLFTIINDEFTVRQTRQVQVFNQTTEAFVTTTENALDENGVQLYNQVFQTLLVDYTEEYEPQQSEHLISSRSIIEIVRPIREIENKLFFQIGKTFEIGSPGTSNAFHMGELTHQDPLNPITTPAIVRLNKGGKYTRTRLDAAKGIDFPVLDDNVSDIYTSNADSLGKVYVENVDAERRKFNLLRHSGKYFDNTAINNLNAFDSGDYQTVDDKFGPITGIIQVGDALKVYQHRKPTSVYIGKSFIKQGDGTDQVMTVDRTFGVVNPSELDYGCVFPESILRNERYVYYYDIYSGSFLRDAPNGIEPISGYLMDGYFKAKSKALLESGISNVRVYTGYDDENHLVLVSFVDSINSTNNETIAFHEPSNRWITFFSFIPDYYGRLGNQLFTTKGQSLYRHNSDTSNRCTFYGTKYSRRFKVFANVDPNLVKTFMSMSIQTNRNGWSAPDIRIDPTATYSRGMVSRLNSNKFIYEEGIGHATFMRNMLTKSSSLDVLQLANGDQLKGEVMEILMEENNNDKTVLYEIDINFTK